MENKSNNDVWAIILAGGKGTRMKSKDTNKVALTLHGKPMIVHTITNLRDAGITNINVVVGFAKESVISHLDSSIVISEQKKRLGTGHAVKVGLTRIENARDIFVLNGDDSYVFKPDILQGLLAIHQQAGAAVTFLTIITDNPTGLGRIVRDEKGRVTGIVEEKDANDEQKKIQEVNPACYLFSYEFLKKHIDKIPKSPVTGEYYLTSLIEIAVREQEKIETFTAKNLHWRGVNTPEELREAEKLLSIA